MDIVIYILYLYVDNKYIILPKMWIHRRPVIKEGHGYSYQDTYGNLS